MTTTMTGTAQRSRPARRMPARVPSLSGVLSGLRASGWRLGRPGQPAPTRPPTPTESAVSVASTAFTMVALVCLWTVAQLLFLGNLSHERAQSLLYGEFRTELASATAPIGPIVPVGDPVALLTIPSLGLQEVVTEGTASGDTLDGPGHRRDTPLPGQEGISVVYGRAATYGGPFGRLSELQPGDPISVVDAQGRITFHVLSVRRTGDPLPQPLAAGKARLTLVTAEGTGRYSAIAPNAVIYVDADAKKSFPAPPGRPLAVPEPERPMATDTGAMPLLALFLALLVALTLGVVAARQKWSGPLVWVVAAPLAIALSWATTDAVMRLLPNVI
ncbi:sortase A [Nocardioides ginsengisegetis]|uniref:Sortase A n=1 Tax=Nocardioides ginsengisegetis TaxID=661491 RepID=A0A7W3PAI9_9ACTN|nr:class E sortase [Nocardioides ginsengisegetis]MBA8804658.1 sortase A [Nocardioides ginsengisegetis]